MTDVLAVEVVYALPERCWSAVVRLPAPATVGQAIAAAALDAPGLVIDPARLAVFGRAVTPESPLRDGDRVEILRPLLIDPKDARANRAGTRRK
jgi:putative ubiquitin-RnfH superfamily antitoxin RatB of RatAB toxin-antitoxin module